MRDGAQIDAIIVTPRLITSKSASSNDTQTFVAAVVWAHGGAFGIGNCRSEISTLVAMATSARVLVVAASFRQGADHPHPASTHDLEDVTR